MRVWFARLRRQLMVRVQHRGFVPKSSLLELPRGACWKKEIICWVKWVFLLFTFPMLKRFIQNFPSSCFHRNWDIFQDAVVPYHPHSFSPKGRFAVLNNRHSYFLLVDNGTIGRYGFNMTLWFLASAKSVLFVFFHKWFRSLFSNPFQYFSYTKLISILSGFL